MMTKVIPISSPLHPIEKILGRLNLFGGFPLKLAAGGYRALEYSPFPEVLKLLGVLGFVQIASVIALYTAMTKEKTFVVQGLSTTDSISFALFQVCFNFSKFYLFNFSESLGGQNFEFTFYILNFIKFS